MANHTVNELDALGQLISLRIFTQIAFFYPVESPSQRPAIVRTLSQGLRDLLTTFPWLAGRVVRDEESQRYKIVHPTTQTIASDTFAVPFYEHDSKVQPGMESLETLRAHHFPMHSNAMRESVICPAATVASPSWPEEKDGMRVLMVRVNWLVDGCAIAILAQHQVLDGVGLGQVLRLYSKACSGTKFTDQEIVNGNINRIGLVPHLGDAYNPGEEMQDQIITDESTLLIDHTPKQTTIRQESGIQPPWAPAPQNQLGWDNIIFTAKSIERIKKMANDTLPVDSPIKWVSSDDALTAFLWQSITRARQPRLYMDMEVRFSRAVDSRDKFGLGPDYMGLMQTQTYHNMTCEELVNAPLGVVAANLRAELLRPDDDPLSVAYRTRALATIVNSHGDTIPADRLNLCARIAPGKDLMFSSWTRLSDAYQLEFGMGLGKPEAIRRPSFMGVEGLAYILPKDTNGSSVVALCLRNMDFIRLEGVKGWERVDPDRLAINIH